MDTSGRGVESGARAARGSALAVWALLAMIGCDVPAVRTSDDASVTSALREGDHLPAAFRDPPPRFSARAQPGGWRFVRPGLDATLRADGGALDLRANELGARLELVEVARGRERLALGAPSVRVDGPRAYIARGGGVQELFVHGEPGIEHLITLERVPGGGGPLEVVVALEGSDTAASCCGALRVEVGARSARVLDARRGVALVYDGVRAWDGRGVELAAWMEADPRGVRLVVDDAGASTPIVIDPLIALPRAVISASDRATDDELGSSLDVEGDIAVVGAPYRAGGGAAYVLERTASGWVERQILVPPMASEGDYAGWSVAISGDTIVVGSPQDNHPIYTAAGAVDVFRRVAAGWVHEARLVNPVDTVTTSSERFGYSVAIAGDVMVVGAIGDRTNGFIGSGAAYVYRRSGTTWSPEGPLVWARASSNDQFGTSVATDGTRIVVGAPYENGQILDGDGYVRYEDVGALFVFVHTPGGWVEQARVAAATERSYEYLGDSVALDGDRILAGATGADDEEALIRERGAAYVFAWTGTSWTEEARLLPESAGDWTQLGELGTSVALQGTTAVVGGPYTVGYGAAYAYERGASGWTQVARVVAAGTTRELGSSIAIEGTTWMVGAPGEDFTGGTDQGAVHVYELVESGAQGQPCGAAGDCTSGFCVDGVCCDVACAGGPTDCQACSVAAGATVDGTCAPVVAGTLCRAAVGACDAAESCDGSATSCPADARAPAGTVCRAATGPCDAEETCSGTAITCPFDANRADGEACDDGMTCNGADACASGVCGPTGAALECDDGDACTADSCAEPGGCAHAPIEGCCASDVDCDDGDPCTSDACASSSCAHTPIAGCGEDAGTGDAGTEDAGSAADAGAGEPDAGSAVDAGGEPDAGNDAGVRADAGARDAGVDAGAEGSTEGGCGCAAPGRSGGSGAPALALLVGIALAGRRRRRCRS